MEDFVAEASFAKNWKLSSETLRDRCDLGSNNNHDIDDDNKNNNNNNININNRILIILLLLNTKVM